jgi:hypothetical protein
VTLPTFTATVSCRAAGPENSIMDQTLNVQTRENGSS